MKRTTIYLRLILTIAAVIGVVLTSCRTLRGFGKDAENAGQQIEQAVD